jgi:hypothetical protein
MNARCVSFSMAAREGLRSHSMAYLYGLKFGIGYS